MERVIIVLSVLVASVLCFHFPDNDNVFEFEQPQDEGKHWALLVAGSNGYYNYRHQADIVHAYQILHKHGIPDERIVVMMYDDIANNRENPVQGNIINKPDGPNDYLGVPKDYTKEEVNPETFLSVLKGDKAAVNGKKVIDSGPNDNVFVNFVDHGGPGILAFGSRMLKAQKLMDAITYLHDNKKYKKLVFYVEACESGSMFYDLLPKNLNVFATTASNEHESSYACYFDETRKTYLGDVYSVKWMEDSDVENLSTETLQKQFSITKNETTTSHAQEYGDLSIGQMTVAEFQGIQTGSNQEAPLVPRNMGDQRQFISSVTAKDPCEDAVKSEDVPLEILRRSLNLVKTKKEAIEIREKIAKIHTERALVDSTVKHIVGFAMEDHNSVRNMMETRSHIKDWVCYEKALDTLEEYCKDHLNIPENDYALRQLYMFVNMCEAGVPIDAITSAIGKVCLVN